MPQPLKPPALHPGDAVRILSTSSPVEESRLRHGSDELTRLGYFPKCDQDAALARDGFFAGSASSRLAALKAALSERETRAVFCARGGYGSNYLLDTLSVALATPKIFSGFSDVTSLHIFLWQKFRWVTFYGPMVASGLDHGAGAPHGYEPASLKNALTQSRQGWTLDLAAETLSPGAADGALLGGCLTLVETSLGTPWELDTSGALLLLEDRGMKPWQIDRALMHLKHAGKFRSVSGILMGDFPECEPPEGSESARDVARRILSPLGIPVVWGAPVGHTARPMLTLPLGVRARLTAGDGASPAKLEILEPAVS
ncbi:MAG: S66 peptidase family protein [Candidatus Acidiferrales bacterium]